jgi:hypothetical protein
MRRALAAILLAAAVAGCGVRGSNHASQTGGATTTGVASVPRAHPQAIEPVAGAHADANAQPPAGVDPVGDVNAHAPPLTEVRQELKLALVYAPVNNAGYIDPLQYVNQWSRTDQGVDAGMPVGAPILAPGRVKILAIIPNWYAGQPLVYFELLDGRQAGQVQYVAEQITDIARPGSILSQGQTIARFAKQGTDIEYGWSTKNGITLAMATSGYEEGQKTPAGQYMRKWLNALGANAGSG